MSKYIAESFYTCLFKITHNLQELTNEALQEIDNRKAIQIRANLDREKQETLDNLRAMREEREIKSKEMW